MIAGRGDEDIHAAGGPARHIPVLREEILTALDVKPGGLYLDGTFGAGGYTRAILATPDVRVVAVDRDPSAIRGGFDLVQEMGGRLSLVEEKFSRMDVAAASVGHEGAVFDGIVLDIGVSSMQLDESHRGFSFRFEGPLDMRMAQTGESAGDIVNNATEERLADILFYYGEERVSRRIAKAIVMDRVAKAPFTNTKQLAEMIARVNPGKPTEIHPATRTFQALRIAVNDELGELVRALVAAERMLKVGGRLVVVSFHSLEDRIVKQFFAARSGKGQAKSRLLPGEPIPPPTTFDVPSRQPILPGEAELARNPRSRSAKLRFGTRTGVAPRGMDEALQRLASLPVKQVKGR